MQCEIFGLESETGKGSNFNNNLLKVIQLKFIKK